MEVSASLTRESALELGMEGSIAVVATAGGDVTVVVDDEEVDRKPESFCVTASVTEDTSVAIRSLEREGEEA